MKKLLAVLLALAMILALGACGAKKTEETKTEETTTTTTAKVGLAVSTLNNPFFVTLVDGAKAKATELGVELTVADANDDTAKQTSDIEDLISKGIQVLIVNPVDSDAVAPAVEDAIAKGIKVIAVDRVVNGVTVSCSIASDNVAGAELAAKFLVEKAGEGAEAIELTGVPGASATNDRGKGFHNIADKSLKVVGSQTANFNREEGMSVMENLLQASPNVKCVFAHNDEMALGALEALNGKEVIVAGFDANDDALVAVKAGLLACTVAQQPALMGSTAVEKAVDLINGKTVAESVPVEVTLVTADNIDQFLK